MRSALLAIFAVLPGIALAELYEYPDRIDFEPRCDLPPAVLRAAEAEYSDPNAGEYGKVEGTSAADLNGDGGCEILLKPPRSYVGTGVPFTMILAESDSKRVHIGDIASSPEGWWYGKRSNGYVRIFVATHRGSRTNPQYVTDVYAFDGKQYVRESGSVATHGYYLDEGFKAYRARDFALAEKHYTNAYRMNRVPTLADANNLVLVWTRLDKLADAKSLLVRHLLDDASADQKAAAYFNLGIIEERKGRREVALVNYKRAYEIAPTPTREQKLRELGY